MYDRFVILDKQQHKTLKLSKLQNLQFASGHTFAPLVVSELKLVAGSFPIVFSSDESNALFGLFSLGEENLFITSEGKWLGKHLPLFFQQYPFRLLKTSNESTQKAIFIDEESSLFSRTRGKQLFKKNGENSETLDNVVEFLSSYDKQLLVSSSIVQTIAKSGILEDGSITTGKGKNKKILVNGFQIVNKERLTALDNATLAEWVRKGIMELIYIHLDSLKQIETLFSLESKKNLQQET